MGIFSRRDGAERAAGSELSRVSDSRCLMTMKLTIFYTGVTAELKVMVFDEWSSQTQSLPLGPTLLLCLCGL